MSDDWHLDAWFETLAGRDTADGPAANEARALRAALRARETIDELALQREVAAFDDRREATLLARARHDPQLAPALARGRANGRSRRQPAWRALLAAGLAGLAVALVWTLRPASETPVYREAPDRLHRMVAADPRALRDEIATALRGAGVAIVTYERFGREGIDGELPRPVTDAVRAVLARYRIPEPADGVLRIEIEAPAPP